MQIHGITSQVVRHQHFCFKIVSKLLGLIGLSSRIWVLRGPIQNSTILKRIRGQKFEALGYSLVSFQLKQNVLCQKLHQLKFLGPRGPTISLCTFYVLDCYSRMHLFSATPVLLASFKIIVSQI